MSILQMSFSASILILVIIVIRAVAINRLPKKTFLAFWAIALIRLLVPFSFPSPFSVYSVINNYTMAAEHMAGAPVVNVLPIPAPMQPESIAPSPISTPTNALSWWTVIWIAGIALCSLYFVIAYVRCYREFRVSITIQNDFIKVWLAEHRIMRPINIRQTTRISAPLTYGIFRPVIVLPLNMDWSNEKQLQYILAHEYTHIRRFDTVTKLFLTAALCIHWFNPLVWAMYILSNRDIELSCDETVVRSFGETIKTAYALALVSMEERRSVFFPYYNSFSKNAIEERIVAIMKIKKTSLIAIGIAFALLIGVATVFATSVKKDADDNPSAQNTTAELPKELGGKYAPLLALRFDGYENMTVAEYRNKIWETIGQDELTYLPLLDGESISSLHDFAYENENQTTYYEDVQFILDILLPVISEGWQQQGFGNAVMIPNPNMQMTDAFGQPIQVSDAFGRLEYEITYTISDANVLTVGECEQIRQGFQDKLYRFLQGKSDEELQDVETMNQSIEAELDRLKKQWEKSALQIVDMNYIFDPLWIMGNESYDQTEDRGTPGTEADYRAALSLKTLDYQNQSVADFNHAVLEWANDNFDAMERIMKDMGWNDIRVELTDEERTFLTLTMGASSAENYVSIMSESYGENADPELGNMLDKEQYPEMWCSLDYTMTYHITDENKLTVGERDRCLGGVINGISSFWEGTRIEELVAMNEQEVIARLQTIASEYSNDLIQIDFGQTHFESMDERDYMG